DACAHLSATDSLFLTCPLTIRLPLRSTLFPYTTLFRSHAVRRLTYDSASAFGIYDRGLVQPGMAADFVVFDSDTVAPVKKDVIQDRKSTRLNSSHQIISYAVFCLKKKKNTQVTASQHII